MQAGSEPCATTAGPRKKLDGDNMGECYVKKYMSKYEEPDYQIAIDTGEGLRSTVHVERKDEEGTAFTICSQGDKNYGIAAFYLYAYLMYKRPPEEINVVSAAEWTYQGPSP